MYKTKKVDDPEFVNPELRILSKMISPEEMDVLRYFKYKDDLKKRWEDKL